MSTLFPPSVAATPIAVLAGGGLDSGVLLAEAARSYPRVHPLYIRTGAVWEDAERAHLLRFLAALNSPTVAPLVTFELPMADVYGQHWSFGHGIAPSDHTPDEAVYLPGRNVVLLSKALIWCYLNKVPEVATAVLAGNPFPDATGQFYDSFAVAVSEAVGGQVRVLRPYAELGLHKPEVVRRGAGLPLEWTFSCLRPVGGRHCGRCNKCGERRQGFADARVSDPTRYA